MSRKNRYNTRQEINSRTIIPGLTVTVHDGNFEKAMKIFNKKVQDAGILRELKEREHYEKPSVVRKKAKNIARKRWLKQLEEMNAPKSY